MRNVNTMKYTIEPYKIILIYKWGVMFYVMLKHYIFNYEEIYRALMLKRKGGHSFGI